jgi:transposase-like protein
MNRPERTEAKAEFFKLLAGGVSVAAAARQVGVHNTVGYYWVKKQRSAEAAKAPPVVRFVELKPNVTVCPTPVSPTPVSPTPVSPTPVRQTVEVIVGEVAIRVEAGFDAQLLRQVVSALSGEER